MTASFLVTPDSTEFSTMLLELSITKNNSEGFVTLAGEEVFTKLNCSVMLFSFALKSATFFSNLPLLPKFKLQDLSLTNSKIVTFEFPPVVCVVLETVLFVVFVAVLLLFPLLSVANT